MMAANKQLHTDIKNNCNELFSLTMTLRSYAKHKGYKADMIDTLDDCMTWLRVLESCSYEISNSIHSEESEEDQQFWIECNSSM